MKERIKRLKRLSVRQALQNKTKLPKGCLEAAQRLPKSMMVPNDIGKSLNIALNESNNQFQKGLSILKQYLIIIVRVLVRGLHEFFHYSSIISCIIFHM